MSISDIRPLVSETIEEITSPVFIKQMIWVTGLWVVTIATLLININFLNTHYGDAPRPDDLILELIPETMTFVTLSEVTGMLGTVLILYIMWTERFRRVPKLLALLGMMYMLRGFTIILTPLGQIQPPAETYPAGDFIAQNFYYGMFFSGHTASAWIQVFFLKGNRLRPVAAVIGCIQVFTLFASHQHYTIDIVGGLLVAYFFTHFDFLRLVPKSLLTVKWMPWYTGRASMKKLVYADYNTCADDSVNQVKNKAHKSAV